MAPKPMGEEELAALLDGHITRSVGWLDGGLARERRKVLQFYDAQKPERVKRGQSSFISQDVFDAVEAMHAQLLETFTGVQELVRFAPRSTQDVQSAQQLTDAVNWVVHTCNPGYSVFSDVIKNGLMSRFGAAKVWWCEDESYEDYEVAAPTSRDALDAMAAMPSVHEVEPGEEVEPGVHANSTVRKKVTKAYPKVEVVPNSELLVSKRARSLDDADFVAHRTKKDRAQLKALGLSNAQIEELKGDDGRFFGTEDEDQLFRPVDGEGLLSEDEAPERKRVWVYECYLRLDRDGTGEKLWKLTKVGNEIIDEEAVKRLPFVAFVALRRPGSFWGNNYATRVIGVQLAKTGLTRAILDHTAITINPRQQVVRGTLQNPAELNDDRLGGIINVNRPDGIVPLTQPPLNPFVFQTLQLLDYGNEDTTGISRLSTGLNKDALSHGNSAALVENLQNAGQIRQKIVARNFAMTFLVPLFTLVAELIAENAADEGFEFVSDGQPLNLPKGALDVKRDLVVELHLGYGEADKEAQKWLMLNQFLSADPTLSHLYTPAQKWEVMAKVMRLKGIKDPETYLTPPAKAPPPQPDPMMQAELALKQQEIQLNQAEMQLKTLETQAKIQHLQAQVALNAQKQTNKVAVEQERMAIDKAKLAVETFVAQHEVAAMEQAEDTPNFKAVAAPNG